MILLVTPQMPSADNELGQQTRGLMHAFKKLGNDVMVLSPFYDTGTNDRDDAVEEIKTLKVGLSKDAAEEFSVISEEVDGVQVYYFVHPILFASDENGELVNPLLAYKAFGYACVEFLMKKKLAPQIIHLLNFEAGSILERLQENADLKDIPTVLSLTGCFADKNIKDYKKLCTNTVKLATETTVWSEYFKKSGDQFLGKLTKATVVTPAFDYASYQPSNSEMVEYPFSLEMIKERPKNKLALLKHFKFKHDKTCPLVGTILHNNDQLDLVKEVINGVVAIDLKMIVGCESKELLQELTTLVKKYPNNLAVFYAGDSRLMNMLWAASDIYWHSDTKGYNYFSLLHALYFGAVPVVSNTGSSKSIVENYDPNKESGNGFVATGVDKWTIFAALVRAREVFRFPYDFASIQEDAMETRYFWQESAKQFVDIYRKLLNPEEGQD